MGYFYSDEYLAHHGIKGQKWGVRRFQNYDGTLTAAGKKHYGVSDDYDGRIIPQNSNFYRITNNKEDVTYDGKKYLSTNKKDHKAWQKYIGDAYAERGYETYNIEYMPVKDLKIAKSEKVGELFLEAKKNDPQIFNQIVLDTLEAQRKFDYKSDDTTDLLSLNFAMQTKTGQQFINQLLDLGYDGIEDAHGRNISKDPIIVFNPEQNLQKKSTYRYK